MMVGSGCVGITVFGRLLMQRLLKSHQLLGSHLINFTVASFSYVWVNRARFPLFSRGFCRAWGKRLLTLRALVKRNGRRRRLVRAGAVIAETAEIGEAAFDGDARLLRIGANSWIGKSLLRTQDRISIGSHVCVSDGVTILTGSHDVNDPGWRHICAPVSIGDYAWIGAGAMILPGVSIGRGAVVGAGAVVAKSIADFSIVVGNPSKPLAKMRCEELDYNPCEFLAANQAWLIG